MYIVHCTLYSVQFLRLTIIRSYVRPYGPIAACESCEGRTMPRIRLEPKVVQIRNIGTFVRFVSLVSPSHCANSHSSQSQLYVLDFYCGNATMHASADHRAFQINRRIMYSFIQSYVCIRCVDTMSNEIVFSVASVTLPTLSLLPWVPSSPNDAHSITLNFHHFSCIDELNRHIAVIGTIPCVCLRLDSDKTRL